MINICGWAKTELQSSCEGMSISEEVVIVQPLKPGKSFSLHMKSHYGNALVQLNLVEGEILISLKQPIQRLCIVKEG